MHTREQSDDMNIITAITQGVPTTASIIDYTTLDSKAKRDATIFGHYRNRVYSV